MIETSNHSRVRCDDHPNEYITNYCCNFNCLRPLCPECVEIHTKSHSKQYIESWKNCLNRSFKSIKVTLQRLRYLQSRLGAGGNGRPLEAIEEEAARKLSGVRRQLHELIDEMLNYHEKYVRSMIRSEFRVASLDTQKLKMAIEELDKLSMKLSNPNTVLGALKKSILLDHQSLLAHFETEFRHIPRPTRDEFPVIVEADSLAAIRKELEDIIKYQSAPARIMKTEYFGPRVTSLALRSDDYFKDTGSKFLHFFVPYSTELKLLNIDNVEYGRTSWKTVRLHIKNELPSFAKSIITPDGRIYLIGGYNNNYKLNTIYRYDEEKSTLELEGTLQVARSSHSVCYMAGCIYIIGGFKNNKYACTDCETFNITTKKTKTIGALCHPSANSSATGFNEKYVFKFGGVRNKVYASDHVEMYSVVDNAWVEIDPTLEKEYYHFCLLSFSACVQINYKEIFVFGGYNDSEEYASSNLSYTLQVNEGPEDITFLLTNIDSFPLPVAEGFWYNNPIMNKGKLYALQNITDTDYVASLTEERRLLIFNGKKWLSP